MQVSVAGNPAALAGSASAPQPRLVRAAHEFEAQMMKELMQPLHQGSSLIESGDDQDSGSGDALGEFATEALGRALSQGGGFGIAAGIVKQLSPAGNQNGTVPVIGNLHVDTGMRRVK